VLQFINTVRYFETLYGFRLHHSLCHPAPFCVILSEAKDLLFGNRL